MTNTLFRSAVAHPEGFRDVDPILLSRHLRDGRIVDVREPHEFDGGLGHIPGAELVPLGTLGKTAKLWEPDAAIVLVCRSGGRSAAAARLLVRLGFSTVMNLRGGMLAWNETGLPVEHGDARAS